MIVLIIVFPSLFHHLLKVLECRCCTPAETVLSPLRLKLTAQGAAHQCAEPSVIPLSYPGAHCSPNVSVSLRVVQDWYSAATRRQLFFLLNFGDNVTHLHCDQIGRFIGLWATF